MSPSAMALEAMSYHFRGDGPYVHGRGLVELK